MVQKQTQRNRTRIFLKADFAGLQRKRFRQKLQCFSTLISIDQKAFAIELLRKVCLTEPLDSCIPKFNKNAFQQDAYRPLVDRMLQSASRRGGVSAPKKKQLPGGKWRAHDISATGGCLLSGWCLLPGGVSPPRGVSPPWGCIPACTEADTLPPLFTEFLKLAWWKCYLGRDFVAAGNCPRVDTLSY